MNVREFIEFLSQQDPEALVVEEVSLSNDEYVEVSATSKKVFCALKESSWSRRYRAGRGRIPCIVLDYDNTPRK